MTLLYHHMISPGSRRVRIALADSQGTEEMDLEDEPVDLEDDSTDD